MISRPVGSPWDAWRELALVAVPVFLVFVLVAVLFYIIGKRRGQSTAKLMGGYCEVCSRVADRFYVFRGTITCERCMKAILANRDMKCRFCGNPIENCTCI